MPRLRTLVCRIPSAFTADSDDNNHGDQNAQPDQHIIVCGSGAPIEFPQSSFGPCLAGSLPFGTISVEPSPWNRDSLESFSTRSPTPRSTASFPRVPRNDRITLVTELSRWRPLRLPVAAALGASRQTRLRGVTRPLPARQKPPIGVKETPQNTRVTAAVAFVSC